MIRHAGLVALQLDGDWRGVLIEGPSGSGKSDLALRALGEGFRLVADDRVVVWASGDCLWGRAPDPLAGLLESRGVGVLPQAAIAFCRIHLVIRCETSPGAVERSPAGEQAELSGVTLPVRPLWPFDPAAPAKLRRSIEHLGAAR
jgi:serine kinase of HPr protein (carbohydrate metabolism regulator)